MVDNTNVLAAERAVYIEAAKAAGFSVVVYYFDVELRAAIARNNRRQGKQAIPVPGVIGTYKRRQPPKLEEGIDRIYTVRLTPENQFVVEP